jgi:hypothetical protein
MLKIKTLAHFRDLTREMVRHQGRVYRWKEKGILILVVDWTAN